MWSCIRGRREPKVSLTVDHTKQGLGYMLTSLTLQIERFLRDRPFKRKGTIVDFKE